jgi:ribonucleotide monophosphatase NagD (HAD superfamily)
MFEYAADATAMVMGKPSSSFFLQAIESIGCVLEEVVVVGDDITTDIQGAGAVGAMSVLVRTGKYSDETLARYPQIKPTRILDSLGSLPGLVGL